jgi:hypothetical protein
MNAIRVVVLLTIGNVFLVLVTLILVTQVRPVVGSEAPVLRVHALQIVDDEGRVRASLAVYPADPSSTFEGRPYPETVLLRLIDPSGGPDVKLSANERGGILVLGGGVEQTYAQFGADGTSGWVKLVGREGREQTLRP